MRHPKTNHPWFLAVLEGVASARAYPLVIGVIACLLTVSMTIPFAPILIGAVLLNRQRWVAIVIVSSFGSASGGLFLYLGLHHLGWNQVVTLDPALAQSQTWITVTRWVSAYGTWALLVFAASPLPQTPVLVLTAVSRLPVIEVLTAVLCGKLLKYTLYGYLAARFPDWVQRYARQLPDRFAGRDPADASGRSLNARGQ
jgi:membrane protein YqaA with SNARE-associated domain